MSYKKIFLLIVLILSIFSCTSCENSGLRKEKFTVIYHPEGGEMKKTEQTFKDHNKVEMLTVERPGYVFLGWYNTRGVKINKIYANKDYELFAKWYKIPIEDKTHEVIMSDINLVDFIEITEDGLSVNLIEDVNKEFNYEVIFAYGEQSDFKLDSENAFVSSLKNDFNENLESNYTNSFSVRVYYEEELANTVNCYYSKVQTFKLLDLVSKDFNDLEKDILLAHKLVPEIRFNLNTSAYTVQVNSNLYNAVLSRDSQQTYIKVTITLSKGYIIYKDAVIYRNDKIITQNFEINESLNVLTYTIDDPNWTQGW